MLKNTWFSRAITFASLAIQGKYASVLKEFTRSADGGFKTVKLPLPGQELTIVATPQEAKDISIRKPLNGCPMSSVDRSPALAQRVSFFNKIGLFSVKNTDGHKPMRKPMNVLAQSGLIDDLPDINKEAKRLAGLLQTGDGTKKVYPYINEYASRVGLIAFFGVDPDDHKDVVASVGSVFKKSEDRIFKIFLRMAEGGRPLMSPSSGKDFKIFYEFIDAQVSKALENEGPVENQSVLTRLIDEKGARARKQCPEMRKEIKEEICHALMAGIQSTTTGITWTIHDLARNPDVQNRLRHELQDVLSDSVVDMKETRTEYLRQVVDESLRMHSIVPISLPRSTNGRTDEAIVVSMISLNHDETLWDKPEIYNPDRMTKENIRSKPSGTFIPFFSGHNSCPGQIYYRTAVGVALSYILPATNIQTVSGKEDYPGVHVRVSRAPEEKAELSFTPLQQMGAQLNSSIAGTDTELKIA